MVSKDKKIGICYYSALSILIARDTRYYKLPEIFEQHKKIVESKIGEFQAILKKRIEQFERELELYAKQCDELQYWGNIEEIYRYKKKADRLDNKLIAAMDVIDEFNEEEELFAWELSEYPLRKTVSTLHVYTGNACQDMRINSIRW